MKKNAETIKERVVAENKKISSCSELEIVGRQRNVCSFFKKLHYEMDSENTSKGLHFDLPI